MTTLKSMTGFGRADMDTRWGHFNVQIKAVNHRFADIKVYLPRDLGSLEIPLTRCVKEQVARGKVDVSINWTPSADFTPRARFNVPLLQQYEVEVAEIAGDLQRQERIPMEHLLALPGVTEKSAAPDIEDEALLESIQAILSNALEAFIAERKREGDALAAELSARLAELESIRSRVEQRAPAVTEAWRERLQKKAAEWAANAGVQIDPGRLEAEVLLFAEKSDVTEELVRLQSHIAAFGDMIGDASEEPKGKSMEFLAQELLRETNTIASKSRDTDMATLAIRMKNEIEKIREQVLNVE